MNGRKWFKGQTRMRGGAGRAKPQGISRRSPFLFYTVLIVCGIASGFVFEDWAVRYAGGFWKASPLEWALVMALPGAVFGGILAYRFARNYCYAANSLPWLLLGMVSLAAPPLFLYLISVVLWVFVWVLAVAAVVILARVLFAITGFWC